MELAPLLADSRIRGFAIPDRSFVDSLGVELVFQGPAPSGFVDADAVRFAQLVANLVVNAANFSRPVELSPRASPEEARRQLDVAGPRACQDVSARQFGQLARRRPLLDRVVVADMLTVDKHLRHSLVACLL